MFARIVMVSTSNPSARKKPLSAATSRGSVLIPGPVDAIFIGSRVAAGDIFGKTVQTNTKRKAIQHVFQAGITTGCSDEQ
jgi:hypothetical protein